MEPAKDGKRQMIPAREKTVRMGPSFLRRTGGSLLLLLLAECMCWNEYKHRVHFVLRSQHSPRRSGEVTHTMSRALLVNAGAMEGRRRSEGKLLVLDRESNLCTAIEKAFSGTRLPFRSHMHPKQCGVIELLSMFMYGGVPFSEYQGQFNEYIAVIDGMRENALDEIRMFICMKVRGVVVLGWNREISLFIPVAGTDAFIIVDNDIMSSGRSKEFFGKAYPWCLWASVSVEKESSDLAAILLYVIILTFSFISIVSLIMYVRARATLQEQRRFLRRRELRRFKAIRYSDEATPLNIEICSICMEIFSMASVCRVLPCNHIFHTECVDPWLLEHSDRCPYCQKSLLECEGEEI
jgi:Ring finger domain